MVRALTGLSLALQLAHPDRVLSPEASCLLEEGLKRRAQREPLTQIAGRVIFDGLTFQVNRQVLTPRPESEMLVDEAFPLALGLAGGGKRVRILDTFTGTGALGISLARRLQDAGAAFDLTLADLSRPALDLAEENAKRLLKGLTPDLCTADIWPEGGGPYDLVLANPPYVRRGDLATLMPEVRLYEPPMALDGGEDGLDFYRRLALEGKDYLVKGGFLVLETGAGQGALLAALFRSLAWDLVLEKKDLAGQDRLMILAP